MTTIRPSAQPIVEGSCRRGELGQAVAAEDLEDRLPDRAEGSSPAAVDVALRRELAGDRAGRRHAARPDRVGAVGGRGRPASMPTTRVMNVSSSASSLARRRRAPRARGRAPRRRSASPGGVGAPSYETTRRIVVGQQRRPERASTAVRVPEDIDRAARLRRERVGDRGHVLELALDRVRRRVARRAAAAPVDGVDREALGEQRPDDPERRVVGGRAVDQDQRRPVAGS